MGDGTWFLLPLAYQAVLFSALYPPSCHPCPSTLSPLQSPEGKGYFITKVDRQVLVGLTHRGRTLKISLIRPLGCYFQQLFLIQEAELAPQPEFYYFPVNKMR